VTHSFPEHPLGWHFRRDDLVFVYIPKCASTATKAAVQNAGFVFDGYVVPPDVQRGFAVVRNPLARFVSGVIRYFKGYQSTTLAGVDFRDWLPRMFADMEVGAAPLVLDPHTQPQVEFLEPFSSVEIDVIPLAFLQDGVDRWFRSVGVDPPVVNVTNETQPSLTQFANEHLTPHLIDVIDDFYAPDWCLFRDAVKRERARELAARGDRMTA
jgi:hypothetical protein